MHQFTFYEIALAATREIPTLIDIKGHIAYDEWYAAVPDGDVVMTADSTGAALTAFLQILQQEPLAGGAKPRCWYMYAGANLGAVDGCRAVERIFTVVQTPQVILPSWGYLH